MINKKLKSNTGVSIAAALLVFLVCVVLGGAVLAAASAAAGRVSRLAATDKRYYNVTSAAELLSEELGETTVVVTRYEKKELTSERQYAVAITSDANGNETTSSTFLRTLESSKITYQTKIGDGDKLERIIEKDSDGDETANPVIAPFPASIEMVKSVLSAETAYLLFGNETCNTADAMDRPVSRPQQIDPIVSTLTLGDMVVNARYKLRSDGVLVIELDDKADGDNDYYMLKLMLTPVIDDREESDSGVPETTTTKINETASGYTLVNKVKTTTERTRTSKVKWVVTGVEKPVKVAST